MSEKTNQTPSAEENQEEDFHSAENDTKNETTPSKEDKPWNKVSKDPSLIKKGTELFVGNLCFETNEEDLYENFKECGEIIDVRNIDFTFI